MRAEKTTRDTAIPSSTHTTHQSVQPLPFHQPLPCFLFPLYSIPTPTSLSLSLSSFIPSFLHSCLHFFLASFLPPFPLLPSALPYTAPQCPTPVPVHLGQPPSAYTVCLDRTEMQRGDCRRKHLLYGSDYITSYTAWTYSPLVEYPESHISHWDLWILFIVYSKYLSAWWKCWDLEHT